MNAGRMDLSGVSATNSGWVCGMIGTILSGLVLLLALVTLGAVLLGLGLPAGMRLAPHFRF